MAILLDGKHRGTELDGGAYYVNTIIHQVAPKMVYIFIHALNTDS